MLGQFRIMKTTTSCEGNKSGSTPSIRQISASFPSLATRLASTVSVMRNVHAVIDCHLSLFTYYLGTAATKVAVRIVTPKKSGKL